MMLKNIYIVFTKEEIKYISSTTKTIYTFSPIILKELKKLNKDVIHPKAIETSFTSEKRLNRVHQIAKKITKKLNLIKIFKEIDEFEELLSPFIQIRLSCYQYIDECLPVCISYYLYIDGNWKKFSSKVKVIIEIEKKLSKQKAFKLLFNVSNFYNEFLKEDSIKFKINNLFGKIQLFLLNKFLKDDKKTFLLSSYNQYFLPEINRELNKKNKKTLSFSYSYSIKSKLKSLFFLFFNTFFIKKYKNATFFLIPNNLMRYQDVSKEISEIFPKEIGIAADYQNKLIDEISKYLIFTDGLQNYLKSFIEDTRDMTAVLHATRFPELYSIASIMSKNKFNSFLITHGTHTLQNKNSLGYIANEQLALALLFSKLNNIIHCSPSIFSDDYLLSKNCEFKKIYPLNLLKKQKISKRRTKLRILHASTVKNLNFRTFYYESSFEYIDGLKLLAKKLENLSNKVEIIVRPRFIENELANDFLKKELQELSHILRLTEYKNFLLDLSNCDCLISLSSTTLEQAFNMKIPCLSFGYTNYDHFANYNYLNINNNMDNYYVLKEIEVLLGRKFLYSENPINKREDFMSLLLNN